ncbi:MAG: flagellar biosynthesis protein FlhF [Pseudomonadota bacterium]
MKLRRFLAPDARSGLERIREELGPDAVVVGTRKTPQGVEFMAGRYDDPEQAPVVPAAGERAGDGSLIWRELARLRALLQNQLAGFAWSSDKRRYPLRIHVLQKMLGAGFSPRLARHLAAALPKCHSPEQAEAWLRLVLIRNLRTAKSGELPGSRPGVWALVGPTGHGKTTTLAKLAARAALLHGPEKVVLISVDAYRIGAREQLQAYAKMMGAGFIALNDAAELKEALSSPGAKACVMVDGAGFAPGDERFGRQLAALGQAGAACLLTLAASSQGSLVESIVRRQPSLDGAILTKLDEGGLCGAVLDCLMRYRLELVCLSTGQRVPEDLHPAHAGYVVDRALRARETGSFAMREEDWAAYAGMEAEQDTLRRSG